MRTHYRTFIVQARLALGKALSSLDMDASVPLWHSNLPGPGTHWQPQQVQLHPSGASTARGAPRRPLYYIPGADVAAATAAAAAAVGRGSRERSAAAAAAFTSMRVQARVA